MSCLVEKFAPDTVEMRQAYCDALIAEAKVNDKLMVIDADVSHSVGTGRFYAAFPERAVNCGIMEAQAVGMSAGLSATGLVPFFHAFGVFATRRVFDQLFLSCAYQDLNVKIIGADPGVTAATNGGTHMPFEDLGLMRLIPGATVIEPADSTMYASVVHQMAEKYGVFYLRTSRRVTTKLYRDGTEFKIGKAMRLYEGKDVCLIACGIMVYEALKARELLKAEGIDAGVIDMHTLKPLDNDAVLDAAKRCGAIVTAENHNAVGGLGSAVSELLGAECPTPIERVGVFESFGEVGTQAFLQERFRLTAAEIARKAKICIERKGGNK
ncbi:MAG: transketolase family protein [Clostridia bacterium]|nr:transketolase family protein [Clostridia bacterium]